MILFAVSLVCLVGAAAFYALGWRQVRRAEGIIRETRTTQALVDETLERSRDVVARVEEWTA